MSKENIFKKNQNLITILFALLLLATLIASTRLFLSSRYYPFLSIAGINIDALTKNEVEEKLNQNLDQRLNQKLIFYYQESSQSGNPKQFELTLSQNSFEFDKNKALDEAFQYGHHKFYRNTVNIPLEAKPSLSLKKQLSDISQEINKNPLDSQLKIEDGQITATPSQEGLTLDEEELFNTLLSYANTGKVSNQNLPVKIDYPKLSYSQGLEIKKRLDQIKLTPLKLNFKELTYTLSLSQILDMIDLQSSQPTLASANIFDQRIILSEINIGQTNLSDTQLSLNKQKVNNYLNTLSKDINQEVQEPILTVDPNSDPQKPRILEFQPPTEGRKLDQDKAYLKLTQALLTQNQVNIELPVQTVSPKNKLTNDLGIKELIGRGISNFAGSIPNRIYNIQLTTDRINGKLISPGEVFSFNNTIGDVSAANGYKQAYVIKSGRTVLDDGGGVCQVSSTIFRTALNSGLPIVKRTAHAYRVGYYEQGFPPGLDATIFTPSVDFQFKNDTPNHILVQAYTQGTTLYIDFYGTSDGRVSNLSTPVITNRTPSPPELRQDDPTLPKGTVKQVDFAAAGATVVFSRTVTRNGETLINESFKSVYRPWQAVYLVGTGG